jgi:hypothetical protein
MKLPVITVGDTFRTLELEMLDEESGLPVDQSGLTSAQLLGKSKDVAKTFTTPATLDAARGLALVPSIGGVIESADLGRRRRATYDLRLQTFSGSLQGYSRAVRVIFEKP